MSTGLFTEITEGGMGKIFVDILSEELSPEDRKQIAYNLSLWLSESARKKPVPDLENRLAIWGKKFDKLAESCKFSAKDDEVVVTVADEDSPTMAALNNGTDWFDPCDNVVSVMISALLKS